MASATLLIAAHKVRRHPRTRIAVHVDRSPQHLAASLRPLLTDADPLVRRSAVEAEQQWVRLARTELERAAETA